MGQPYSIIRKGDCMLVVYSGRQTLDDLSRVLEEAVRACRDCGCGRIMVDLSQSTQRLSTTQKFRFGELVSSRIAGLKVAYVPSRARGGDGFFETVALNRGARIRRFRDEREALDWLFKD